MSELLLDRAGRRRSPATLPGFHAGRPPHNKGLRYPAEPAGAARVIDAVFFVAGDGDDEWETELLAFPNAAHDDQVDTAAYAARELDRIPTKGRRQRPSHKTTFAGIKDKQF